MELRACRKCKKIFQYAGGKSICPVCMKEEEEIFLEVKDYLRENSGASLEKISEETRASVQMIQAYIREGRIEVAAGSPIALSCEKCGKSIVTGRYCKECMGRLASQLQGAADAMGSTPSEQKDRAQYTFLNKDNYRG